MRERSKAFYAVFLIAAALIVPAAITLRTIVHPAILQVTSDNPTPLGYTWSLALFVIPIAVLALWFASRPDLKFPRKAFWRTIGVLTPLGFALDLLFGNAFFVFPNKLATIGWEIPALGGGIPVEEFVFYLTGFMLVLLSYIWCDEYWMAAYNVPDYEEAAKDVRRIVRFHFASLILGVVLIGAAIAYRKFLAGTSEGFPWYFVYLVCASLIPSAGFFYTAQPSSIGAHSVLRFFCFSLSACYGRRRLPCHTAGGNIGAIFWSGCRSERGRVCQLRLSASGSP